MECGFVVESVLWMRSYWCKLEPEGLKQLIRYVYLLLLPKFIEIMVIEDEFELRL
ncbi:hypothetical protein HanXRQr2_Chr05g0231331 [Helianthus annuus]|uniref:Uncharacterized protein n=1 Tax=Helianthus annuus TaxID=4232 RepID=A0A9K3J1L5_HELAN|nr:hypothetical protein HanXRQr2_Chr05g0231331 [Helianthus annuus]KAJ0923998.1 hypothetical protein HanPSC8_Chr05g0223171 [Helianthus annuus]